MGSVSVPTDVVLDGQLMLRCMEASDAPALDEAVRASLEPLRAWMPWAQSEPITLGQRRALLAQWRVAWESGASYSFGIFDGATCVGACALHRRIVADGLEIGYWVREDFTGRGVASKAAAALCDVAFGLDRVTYVEIHHDRANVASSRIPEKLCFDKISEGPDLKDAPAKVGIECIWQMTAGAWRSRLVPGARDSGACSAAGGSAKGAFINDDKSAD